MTPKQEKVLAALMSETTLALAAKKAGVSEVTLWRYLQAPLFRRAYLHARRQLVEETVTLLQRASKKAVATLIRNMDCGSHSVEVAAARSVLDSAFRGVELMELEERIRGLEEEQEAEERRRA